MLRKTNFIATSLVFFFATSFVINDAQAQGKKRISNQHKVSSQKSGGQSKRNRTTGKSSQRGGRSQGLSKADKSTRSRLNAPGRPNSFGINGSKLTGSSVSAAKGGRIAARKFGKPSETPRRSRGEHNARFNSESSKSPSGTAMRQRSGSGADQGDVMGAFPVRALDAEPNVPISSAADKMLQFEIQDLTMEYEKSTIKLQDKRNREDSQRTSNSIERPTTGPVQKGSLSAFDSGFLRPNGSQSVGGKAIERLERGFNTSPRANKTADLPPGNGGGLHVSDLTGDVIDGSDNEMKATMFQGGGNCRATEQYDVRNSTMGEQSPHRSPFFGQDQETGEIIDFGEKFKHGVLNSEIAVDMQMGQNASQTQSVVDSEGWDEVPPELMFRFRAGSPDRNRSGFDSVKPNQLVRPSDSAKGLPTKTAITSSSSNDTVVLDYQNGDDYSWNRRPPVRSATKSKSSKSPAVKPYSGISPSINSKEQSRR